MAWKVVSACHEQELQEQLDKLQARLPSKDEHGDFHIVGSIPELVPIGVCPLTGKLVVVARFEVSRDPPLPNNA